VKIYHIVAEKDWQPGRPYQAESLSREGFIHFSRLDQVLGVANAFYAGQRGLLLLEVDVERLIAELRWEAPVHPAAPAPGTLPSEIRFQASSVIPLQNPLPESLFPHLYGPLNLEAVLAVHPFEPGPDGIFVLPSPLTDSASGD
jgi:uncharacterized protein (DUF952 family)